MSNIYESIKDNLEESSLSRLYQHTKDKDTFAIIGSQDQNTKNSRYDELVTLVKNLASKENNIGYNKLEGTYTYEDGEIGVENSLIIYNIKKEDALSIAQQINQESIIWKDQSFFGIISSNGTVLNEFNNDDINMNFSKDLVNSYGSRLKNDKRVFMFECNLIKEVGYKGSNFSRQNISKTKKYQIFKLCNLDSGYTLNIFEEDESNESEADRMFLNLGYEIEEDSTLKYTVINEKDKIITIYKDDKYIDCRNAYSGHEIITYDELKAIMKKIEEF